MYPSFKEKAITSDNVTSCWMLFANISDSLHTRKGEDFLVSAVKTGKENDVLAVLIVGQNYELQKLVNSCVYGARRLSLRELKQHTKRVEIDPDNQLQIAEGNIERLEKQVKKCRKVKASCSQKLLDSTTDLCNHARKKGKVSDFSMSYSSLTACYLDALKKDN